MFSLSCVKSVFFFLVRHDFIRLQHDFVVTVVILLLFTLSGLI